MSKYEIILDVCNTGSISKTAAKFNYTQSAVSQLIKNFERELGISLFKRTKQGVQLLLHTGEIVRCLENICREEKKIERIIADLNSLDSGYIRIGSIQSISYHWLPDILRDFAEAYPKITFELCIEGFRPLIEKLKNDKLDCIFVSRYSVPDYPFVPLGDDELMLVTPNGHPLAEKTEVTLSDVDKKDFILTSDRLDYETGKIFEMNGIQPRIRYQVMEDFAALKMVEKGFGITILPKLLLQNAPFDVCVRSFSEHYSRVLGVAHLPGKQLSPAVLKFLSFTEETGIKQA
ncbi:MAG: LysR family transcriptional regulator [Dorea sp.]|jgi:DNA-binding transcriptional LysR family regulator|nr:LysR family transcriptional regulator [Dorea sp.]